MSGSDAGMAESIAETVLDLLLRFGWELGLERLDRELRSADVPGALRALFVAGQAAERGEFAAALDHLRVAEAEPALACWADLARAFIALRRRDWAEANQCLD